MKKIREQDLMKRIEKIEPAKPNSEEDERSIQQSFWVYHLTDDEQREACRILHHTVEGTEIPESELTRLDTIGDLARRRSEEKPLAPYSMFREKYLARQRLWNLHRLFSEAERDELSEVNSWFAKLRLRKETT